MLRALSLFLLVILVATPVLAIDTVRVYFKDKGLTESDLTPGSAKFESTLARLSDASIERRKRALNVDMDWQTISNEDFDVCANYLSAIEATGAEIIHNSRWLNFSTVAASQNAIDQIKQLPFVEKVITPKRRSTIVAECGADAIVYLRGLTAWQQDRINTTPLQWLGIDATNVAVAYFDTGFIWRQNAALDHLNVIGERDFVADDNNTAQEPGDNPAQWGHGTSVLGAAAAYLPDTLIGTAYAADIVLGKTEDLNSETPVEEENYALALEWSEALGARIASSSLGYVDFDSPFVSYTYQDLDGETAISTRAAARAAKLGMLIITAAGNSGETEFPWINAPADADSVLAVGAIAFTDSIVPFSSHGPTPDGRIKPEITAPGVFVMTYDPFGNIPIGTTGTSLATPLVSSAASLIMKAHPEATAQEVRQAIMETGKNAATPDTIQGWGVMDAYAAALKLGPFFGRVTQKFDQNVLELCVGFASEAPVNYLTLWHRRGGGDFQPVTLLEQADSNFYAATEIFGGKPGDVVQYYVEAITPFGDTLRLPKDALTYEVKIGDSIIKTSSVKDRELASSVTLYPNPASKFVEVSSEHAISNAELIDLSGRVMITSPSLTERSKRFMLTDLPSGSYMIRVIFADGGTEVHPLRISR